MKAYSSFKHLWGKNGKVIVIKPGLKVENVDL